MDRFAASLCQSRVAGLIRDFQPRKIAPTLNLRRADLCFQYAAVAVAEALAAAKLTERGIDSAKIGLVVGTTRGAVNSFEQAMLGAMGGAWDRTGPLHFPNLVMSSLGGYVSKMFSLRGAASTVVSASAGGLQAVIHAFELLRCNPTQQAMVVVLADELSPLFFRLLEESGKLACGKEIGRAMVYSSNSPGLVMGEGAAAFVMEKRSSDSGSDLCLSGYGMTSDCESGGALQMSGARFSESILQAIHEARLNPNGIDLIYGHGSGSPCQDSREIRALAQVCKPSVPLSCVLPNTGLSESASAGFSLAAAALSLQHGEAYPIASLNGASGNWNFVQGEPVRSHFRNVLMTAGSDSGNNAALLLTKLN
jgi:3-oxoacyl-[acyl-carrier-protein] synthase II